ncbi:MAG: hypothetical protein ACTSP5_15700 [Candidatus Heimdallarchaeota archaeon]
MKEMGHSQDIIGIDEPSLLKKYFKESAVLYLIIFGIFCILFLPFLILANVTDIFPKENYLFIHIFTASYLGAVLIFVLIMILRSNHIKIEVAGLLDTGKFYTLEEYLKLEGITNYNRKNYAIAALGDFCSKDSMQLLIDLLLSVERISWTTRRITAFAVAKIGTYDAIVALSKALILYKQPQRSMSTRSRYESIYRSLAVRAVTKSLERLVEINGYLDKTELMT